MTPKRRDYLAIVEAAYDTSASDEDWLRGIAAAAAPILDVGLGVMAYTYDAHDPGAVRIGPIGQASGPHSWDGPVRALAAAMSLDEARVFYGASPPVDTMSRIFQKAPPSATVVEVVQSVAAKDSVGVRGHNPDGTGLLLSAPSVERYKLAPRTQGALERVALHLASAQRIRKATRQSESGELADAVFSERGKLEHLAEPEISEVSAKALGSAVEHRILGHRIRREEPERALDLWRALVAGRWSLVNHVDRAGKRFILARRNDPTVSTPEKLDLNERLVALYASWGHSNKLVAYELGISPSCASETLKRALRKLRLKSRAELFQILRAEGQ